MVLAAASKATSICWFHAADRASAFAIWCPRWFALAGDFLAGLNWKRHCGASCSSKMNSFSNINKQYGGSWSRAKLSDPRGCVRFVDLVLYRIYPHFSATLGASGNGQVETVEALPALSEIPGGARPYGGLNFGEEPVVIGVFLLECADVAFAAADIHALAGGVVIQVVRVLDSRKLS